MSIPLRTLIKNDIREKVTGVVFPTLIQGQNTWVSVSRKLKLFNKLDPSVQPCSFVVQHNELYEAKHVGVPPRRTMLVSIWCYAYPGEEIDGDDYLDSMEEGIEAALGIVDDVMRNELTFGGLAYSASIDRASNLMIRDPGDLDGQALLVLPLRVVLP